MKKAIIMIALCLLAAAVISSIYIVKSSKTLDFRGEVIKIEVADDHTVFYISMLDASYTVIADRKTDVSYCCKNDPDIDLSDIEVGDMIEGNYRWLSKSNMARFITVEYHN